MKKKKKKGVIEKINHSKWAVLAVYANLNSGKNFFKLDLSEVYLQIQVEECSELITTKKHKGLYKFEQLPLV